MKAAWILSLCLALPLAAGCPAEDTESGDEGAAPSSGMESATEDPTTESADDSSGDPGPTTGDGEDLQATWGAPCTDDSECVALLGEGGVCLDTAVLFELPGGYCSKMCELPENTKYSLDDPQCDEAGGVDCIGQAPLFQVCAPQCTGNAQCTRDPYSCRNFPLIAEEGDPTYCLMPECCEGDCGSC